MAIKKRWIEGLTREAAKTDIKMPWTRGHKTGHWKHHLTAAPAPVQKSRA